MNSRNLTLVVFVTACAVRAQAQRPASDRYKWMDSTTQTSDDPQRLPMQNVPRGPDGSIVLVGGRVFDGTGTPARAATVVIVRNKISAILPAGSRNFPAGARILDVTGKTVMPGLIDLHTHITYREPGDDGVYGNDLSRATLRGVERLRFFVESGITSVRDVASHGVVPFRLKEWVAANRIPGPRVFAAGRLIAGTGGHGDLGEGSHLAEAHRLADGPDDWRRAVRENFKLGADVIKIASHFSKAEVEAAVDEAHDLGLKVTCDCETIYIQRAVEAGVDMIEHPLPRTDDETIGLMARKGTESVPTLVPYIIIFDERGGYWGSSSRRFTFSKEANLEMVRRMKKAGIKMGIGTDLVTNWYRYLPEAYITELEQFVAAGFTIPEVLVTATKTNAELLDMGDKLGTLAPGKLADVLVVNGRPDTNLQDLTKVDLVIRDGNVVVRAGRVDIPPHVQVNRPKPYADSASAKKKTGG